MASSSSGLMDLPHALRERLANKLADRQPDCAGKLAKHLVLTLARAEAYRDAARGRALQGREWCGVAAHFQTSEFLCNDSVET